MPVRILHFADAHIDMINSGRRDPISGLPQRVVDFLKALDQIIDAAIEEQVDLVLFAGDAYKDRNPQPTFQREWGARIMRLSNAGIPTILLIGNHDMAPAEYRAHTLQEFATLNVANVHIADSYRLWTPADLGVPVHVISLPWVTSSRYMARNETVGMKPEEVMEVIGQKIKDSLDEILASLTDQNLPVIFMAHASVLNAKYGSERQVMLGSDFTLGSGLVCNPRFDYVALGHIHKHQVLNEKPPVIYSGSIERVDFGEAGETKGYVLADVDRGQTTYRFVPLNTRPFLDNKIKVEDPDHFMDIIMANLPPRHKIPGASCRLYLEYPRQYETLLDEGVINEYYAEAFDLHLLKQRKGENRSRLPGDLAVESKTPLELMEIYWRSKHKDEDEITALLALAEDVIQFGTTDLLA